MQRNQVRCKICGKEHALGGCPEWKENKGAKRPIHRDEVVNIQFRGGKANENINVKAGDLDWVHRGDSADIVSYREVDSSKPKMGRPRTGYIKAEYNRQYMADLRTIKRLGLSVTVAQYRKSKET